MLIVLTGVLAGRGVSAHRLDEYLQAARVSIEPARIAIELDLTPGVAVASDVLATVDLDGDDVISPEEARACAARVIEDLAVDVDGVPVTLSPIDSEFPETAAVREGMGTIRLRAASPLPALASGPHRLHYRNAHRSDIGVYLANALVPADRRVAITGQSRSVDQRVLQVDYGLGAVDPASTGGWRLAGLTAAIVGLWAVWWARPRRRTRPNGAAPAA